MIIQEKDQALKLKKNTIKNVELIKNDIISKNIIIPKSSEQLNSWIKLNNYKTNR
ncbi:hypothetical protein ANS017_30440 [Paraclostridium bifermentans]|nr:hypothetical protein ANS014_27970 [Paraclostridium bifermentans]GKZ06398.1 hypothetical protein ANS015_12810 [Paraclostridium bifermentans]GKZ11660.1 hypothetical protein ANS017_30440 [Paraclostridium bifermentans]